MTTFIEQIARRYVEQDDDLPPDHTESLLECVNRLRLQLEGAETLVMAQRAENVSLKAEVKRLKEALER
jgi:hypothetical protein